MALEHLFDAELQYRSNVEPVVSPEAREGELIGNGDGVAKGDKVAGRLRWSMFAADCPYRPDGGTLASDGDHLCTTNPAFVLETEDGETIWFEARGFGDTDDARYAWLNHVFGIWEGVFDEDARNARYSAFVQTIVPEGR